MAYGLLGSKNNSNRVFPFLGGAGHHSGWGRFYLSKVICFIIMQLIWQTKKRLILKPKVYVETSIVSYLTSRPSNDIRAAANQGSTFEWWENRRTLFDVFVSEFVIA